MGSTRTTDPYGAHYFAFYLGKEEVAHFQECTGLKTTATVFEIEEGGLNGYTHKRPGQSKWENITLRYATNVSQTLLEWRDEYLRDMFGARATTTAAIVLKDNDGNEIRRYTLSQCWPVTWEGPQLNAGASEMAVESVEIAHSGVTVSDSSRKFQQTQFGSITGG